jgi:hypothetical protein
MNPERLQQVYELYHAALERQPAERSEFLSQADPELRREVESLLSQQSNELLNRPVWELADFTVTQLAVGAELGPYRIEAPLGAGGMGDVYRARDTRLNRIVAIKILKGQFSERFDREARAISALNHPHICTLYDIGSQKGVGYLVMEHIEGEPSFRSLAPATVGCEVSPDGQRFLVPIRKAAGAPLQVVVNWQAGLKG